MPKLLPLPFGRAVIVPLLPDNEVFQLLWMLWLPFNLMVTTQLLVPLTERLTLKRSDHDWPGLTLTLQLPPPVPPVVGPPPPPVVGPPPPEPSLTVRLELPLLWK